MRTVLIPGVLDYLELPFVQRGLVVVVLLAVAAGLLGTWIVLRGLAFYSHAAASAAFPGLVVADGLAFSPYLGALGTAGLAAIAVAVLGRRERERHDSITGLVLVGALAAGVILASDVFGSGAHVDSLLFGSLLALGGGDVVAAALAAAAAVLATLLAGPRWVATGFDPANARALGLRPGLADAVLLALVAASAIAFLAAVGALLAGALLVVPAATTRLVCTRMGRWQLATIALAAAEGVAGLLLSVELNAPPGATIAVLGGVVFALVAARRALRGAGAAVAAAVVVSGCGAAGATTDDGRLHVVATTPPVADMARAVGGDAVVVTQLLRPSSDPHDYEPRPHDVLAVADADVVVLSGGHLDDWAHELIDQAGGGPEELVLGDVVPVHLAPGDDEDHYDAHWWHDPRNALAAAGALGEALGSDASAYRAELQRLDRDLAACFAAVPASARKLVTDHDSFGYLAGRYDIEILGSVIPSQSSEAQPGAEALSALAAVIEREGVAAVFPESGLDDGLAETLARETGAAVGPSLYGDTLGGEGSGAETYLAMARHNADAIVRGLTGGRRGCPA